MYLPGYKNLAEFAVTHGFHYMTAYNQMKQGYCKWPRKIADGSSKDPAYGCWENMVQRCTNPKAAKYAMYGGRGILVYPPWVHNFKLFLKHIGPRPNARYSIDRIDSAKGYEPGNVRWADGIQQSINKSTASKIEKHRNRYRFTFNNKRYSLLGLEEAMALKAKLQKGYH